MKNSFLNSKFKPHAIIFNITKLADVNDQINAYIKSIVCSDLSKELSEKYSKKIDDGSYYDIIKINGFESGIKKEDILNIQNTFSIAGIEDINIKFYVIYGIENITSQAANSLLKFLEEPPHNTYAIFVTKSPNLILETIKSRCQMYFLKPNFDKYNEIIKKYKIEDSKKLEASSNYSSLDELEKDLSDKTFDERFNSTKFIMNSSSDIKSTKDFLDSFKTFSYIEILKIIDMLISLDNNNEKKLYELKDSLKFNPNKVLIFNQLINLYK